MKRKKILLSLLVLISVNGFAQNTLNIYQKSGGKVSFTFTERPKVEFVGDNLYVKTQTKDVEYPISNVSKFTFSDAEASQIDYVTTSNVPSGYTEVYNTNGVLVKRMKIDDGNSSMPISDLSKGIYIIKNGSTTYKIIKK